MAGKQTRPTWAPRVKRHKIARLYQLDAQGIQDEDLVDEIALAFFARIHDCLTVTRAQGRGEVACPVCGTIIMREGSGSRANHELLQCSECDWELPWSEYHRSIGKKHMGSAGLSTFFENFLEAYPKAKNYNEKMLLIDDLLHRYHWELEGDPGGPGAVNLIGGRRSEVLAFLNTLTYGQESTPGLVDTKERWVSLLNYSGWNQNTVDEFSQEITQNLAGQQEYSSEEKQS